MDKWRFRKKMFYKLANHPVSLIPFAGGATGLIIGLAFGYALLSFGSLVALLGGIGIFLTRVLMGNEKVAQKVLQEIQGEDDKAKRESLEDLRRRLTQDRNPETGELLDELVILIEQFRKLSKSQWSKGINMQSAYDILFVVDALYQKCLDKFEQSLKFYQSAREIIVAEARDELLNHRRECIDEIRKSIEKLSAAFTDFQRLVIANHDDEDISKTMQELDDSLEIARRVEDRLRNNYKNNTFEEGRKTNV